MWGCSDLLQMKLVVNSLKKNLVNKTDDCILLLGFVNRRKIKTQQTNEFVIEIFLLIFINFSF